MSYLEVEFGRICEEKRQRRMSWAMSTVEAHEACSLCQTKIKLTIYINLKYNNESLIVSPLPLSTMSVNCYVMLGIHYWVSFIILISVWAD